jgi:hypothetical protein
LNLSANVEVTQAQVSGLEGNDGIHPIHQSELRAGAPNANFPALSSSTLGSGSVSSFRPGRWLLGRATNHGGLRMNMDDSRIIARFQCLITGFMAAKRLGEWHSELIGNELYRMWLQLEQRGLKKSPEYRNVMLRADRHACWLAGLARLSSPDLLLPLSSKETERIATLSAPQKAA